MDQKSDKTQLNAELIGYHLGLLDEEERAKVEAAFPDKDALAAACDRVAQCLRQLDADEAPKQPAGLVAGILDRVEQSKHTIPLRAKKMSEEVDAGRPMRPLMRMRELVGMAAAIALFVGVFVPGYRTARMTNQQAMCATNLNEMGRGYALYADANAGFMPYAGPIYSSASWLPNGDPNAPYARNATHSFQLVNGNFVAPSLFLCPGRGTIAVPQSRDGAVELPSTYASHIILRPLRAKDFSPESPLAADMNPLVEENRVRVRVGDVPANSRNHAGLGGQNVLRGNLSVRFFRDPYAGIQNDDIYRLIGVQEYTGLERPTLRSDAFLIP